MDIKRLTLFAGHYGSGKTNIALSYAEHLNDLGHKVCMADLDIVNPYFRTKDNEDALRAKGIELIVSHFANSNLDAPAMPKEIYALVEDRESDRFGVLDIGGDDRGALALGRYAPALMEEGNFEFIGVINKARPLTMTPEDTVEVLREIEEKSGGLKFTGLANNTNYGQETEASDILSSMGYAEAVSRLMGIPVKMTCVCEKLYDELKDEVKDLFPVKIQKLYYQINMEE